MNKKKEESIGVFIYPQSTLALSRARLAAVQAVYQLVLFKRDPKEIIDQFFYDLNQEYLELLNLEGQEKSDFRFWVNFEYFECLVDRTYQNQALFEEIISKKLKKGWKIEFLNQLLYAILCVGVYEIIHCPKVPVKVVLNEYTNISSDFLSKKETAFVNSILENIAKEYRHADFLYQEFSSKKKGKDQRNDEV